MIHLAICEDSAADIKKLVHLVSSYNGSLDEPCFETTVFEDSTSLLESLRAGSKFTVFMLDIMMPQTNGIELGKAIRSLLGDVVIIYITSSKEHALDAFGVLAQRYLLKPIEEEKLFEALSFAKRYATSKQTKIFTLKTPGNIVGIPFKNILYAECSSRSIHIHCVDGSIYKSVFIRQNFEFEIGALLIDPSFVQTHKSFAVNMEYVEKLRNHAVLLNNGFAAPIARKRQAEVKREYLAFLSKYGSQ